MKGFDKTSYRNRGGILQKAISQYKLSRFFSKYGHGNVIKSTAKFLITDGAYLEIGNNCTIQDYALIALTKPHPRIIIGNNVVIGLFTMLTNKNLIKIGNDVIFGSFVQVIDTEHGIATDKTIRLQDAVIGEVTIGNDCWIGAGAKILMNAHIGDGAVIGANAVVTQDIPSYAVAAGVPARIIKYRGE